MMRFPTTEGVLKCEIGTEGPRMVVELDTDFGRYARALIPKYLKVQPPRYPPHVTVVRQETVDTSGIWREYRDKRIWLEYWPRIIDDGRYYWYGVQSKFLVDVRRSLGLPDTTPLTRSPDGLCPFHITVGNRKHVIT